MTRELWGVLSSAEKASVLAEEKSVLESVNCMTSVSSLSTVKDFIDSTIDCSNFQGLLVAILDKHSSFMTLPTLILKRTFLRLKCDYSKSLVLMILYKGFVGLVNDGKDPGLKERRALFMSYTNGEGVVYRVFTYLRQLQEFWTVAREAADGDETAERALNTAEGAFRMINGNMDGE